jgi:hypothetical protein
MKKSITLGSTWIYRVKNPGKNDIYALELSNYKLNFMTSFGDKICGLFVYCKITDYHYPNNKKMSGTRVLCLNPPYRGE